MARHAQRPQVNRFVCTRCKEHECKDCMDAVRARLGINGPTLCRCTKGEHHGNV